jgi:hypothetical protein
MCRVTRGTTMHYIAHGDTRVDASARHGAASRAARFALALSDDRAFGRERRTQTASRVRRFLMSINAAL